MVNYIKLILKAVASIPSIIILVEKINAARLRKAKKKKDMEIDDGFDKTEQDGDSSHIEDIYISDNNK